MQTNARVHSPNAVHWYSVDGQARHEIEGKTTGKPRPVTLRDAKENGWLPSVTSILDAVLRKPALEAWKTEQAVIACLTAPRNEGEEIDAFVKRVLQDDQQQNQEASIARDKGTEIHAGFEDYFCGREVEPTLKAWIQPALDKLQTYGQVVATEKILIGDGYAGKTDLILEAPDFWWIWDIKSTKKLPDPKKGGAWLEHRLQLAGYAQAFEDLLAIGGEEVFRNPKPIRTANLYVSSVTPGSFVVCEHDADWQTTFNEGFAPLVTYWQWANKYRPAGTGPRIITRKEVDAMHAEAVKGKVEELPAKDITAPTGTPAAVGLPPNAIALKDGKHVVYSLGQVTRPQ